MCLWEDLCWCGVCVNVCVCVWCLWDLCWCGVCVNVCVCVVFVGGFVLVWCLCENVCVWCLLEDLCWCGVCVKMCVCGVCWRICVGVVRRRSISR